MWSISCLIPFKIWVWHILEKFIFYNIKSSFFHSCPHYVKSPSPFGEGLNFRPNHLYTAYRSAVNLQPDHLYPTYRSVANLLCTIILTSTKQKVKKLSINILCPDSFFYSNLASSLHRVDSKPLCCFSPQKPRRFETAPLFRMRGHSLNVRLDKKIQPQICKHICG